MEKRSVRYNELAKMVDKNKIYTPEEAMELVKKASKAKFTPSIEVHIRLNMNLKKTDEQIRGSVVLPHGTGKTKKVAVFAEGNDADAAKKAGADFIGAEDLIDDIAKSGTINFDVAIATPSMMVKLSKLARILGPKGLMPNPKVGTVTTDVAKAVLEQKAGKVAFKNDKTGIVHQVIGKSDFTEKQLLENFNTIMEAIKAAKPETIKRSYLKTISINSTMGPGIKVSIQ